MTFDKRVVDSHVHIVNDEPALERMLNEMRLMGINDITIQSLAAHYKYDFTQNIYALALKSRLTDMRVRVFASVHELDELADIPYLEQAQTLLDIGADGFKFIQMKPDVRRRVGKGICHESYDSLFSMLEERRVPVTIHTADPKIFWDPDKVSDSARKQGWFYGDGQHMSYEEHLRELFRMLDKHPRLKAILAHFCFLDEDRDRAAWVLDRYPEVRLDLTPHPAMIRSFSSDVEGWRDFFIKYADRLVFGTDADNVRSRNINIYKTVYYALRYDDDELLMPAYYQQDYMRTMHLPDLVVEKIASGNFLKLVGEEPKPLNSELMMRAAKEILGRVCNSERNALGIKWLKSFIAANG